MIDRRILAIALLGPALASCISRRGEPEPQPEPAATWHPASTQEPVVTELPSGSQTPTWTGADREFFLNGSLSNEVFPERILAAFEGAYPELYPGGNLASFGVLAGGADGLPIGFSRAKVDHLGGQSSLGVNCAACHSAQINPVGGGEAAFVFGAPNQFNTEAFLGAFVIAMGKTAEPAAMKHFLLHYLEAGDPQAGAAGQKLVQAQWTRQADALAAAISGDPTATKGLAPGTLHDIPAADLRLDGAMVQGTFDLLPITRSMLKLFQNVRTVLHLPAQPPANPPPPSGPGRFDAFGLISVSLYGVVPPVHAPVKYGVLFNLDHRSWVHWDGNTGSPIVRNLFATLGLGAPLLGKHGKLDIAKVSRHTQLSQGIRPPGYPWSIDRAAAGRGKPLYTKSCAACHDGPENDARLHTAAEVGTDDARTRLFDENQAKMANDFIASLQIDGFQNPAQPTVRSTGKYWSAELGGVWARAPYLHNGSVPTMWDLLTPPANRPKTWHRGTTDYDTAKLGYADGGAYVFDTAGGGNGNGGHAYGTELSDADKKDLIEYLKTK